MQEEVEQKTLALVISATKLTGRELKKALVKFLAYQKNKKNHPNIPQGKQPVKALAKQGQGMTSLDMNDTDIKLFDKTMKKYGVDYSVVTDKSIAPPKHTLFFKGKDADAITKAFSDFTIKATQKLDRPSVLAELKKFVELVKQSVVGKVKNKEKEQTR